MSRAILVRYAMVGVVNTTASYSIILALQGWFGMDATLANLFGFCAGWLISFLLNRRFAFRHSRATGSGLMLFAVGAAVCWCVNAAVLHMSLQLVPSQAAQALAMLSYTISFYFWNRHVVFPEH